MPKVQFTEKQRKIFQKAAQKKIYVGGKDRGIMQRPKVLKKPMGKTKILEQTPTGMANKTGSDAVIPPAHSQRKPKL